MTEGEENTDQPVMAGKFICVCSFCNNHDKNASVEFNFREISVFYVCSECRKLNTIVIENKKPSPYPRSRTGLR